MAGDWIKFRKGLFTHPKVVRISSALKADRLRTIGGLLSAWCLFDEHSEDGKLDGYTFETLDDLIGWPGFSAAMASVSWLTVEAESLALPEFDTHNGQSAKRRCQDADRKDYVRKLSASETDKNRTREEKNREEKKTKSKTPKHPMPEGFYISDSVKDWATKNGHIRLEEHFESFKIKAVAKGYQYVDWDSAFMGAVRDDWAKLQVTNVTPIKTRKELGV